MAQRKTKRQISTITFQPSAELAALFGRISKTPELNRSALINAALSEALPKILRARGVKEAA